MNFFDGDLIHEAAIPAYKKTNTVEPDANIYDLGHEFIVKLEMPGISENIEVALNKGELVVAGNKKISCDSAKPILAECKNSYFMREIIVPDGITIEDITTEYVDGILTIHIPKKKVLLSKSAMVAYDKQLTDNALKILG